MSDPKLKKVNKSTECETCQGYDPKGMLCNGGWEYVYDNGEERFGSCDPRRAYAKRKKSDALFASSKLSPRFKTRTFFTFNQTADTAAAYRACKSWCDKDHSDGVGLLLNGPVGTGKTHLVASILNHWLAQGELGVFVVVSDFFGELRTAMSGSDESSDEIIDRISQVPLLILDDMGVDKASEWQQSSLYRIINHRYENFLPLIITTNLGPDEIKAKLGNRTHDRLIEACDWHLVGGESYRREIAKERKA